MNSESLLALTEGSVLARESSIANHQMNGDKVNQDWRRIAGQSTTRLDKESYCRLRDKYCAEVFPDLYDKVVASKSEITQNHLKGILGPIKNMIRCMQRSFRWLISYLLM